MWLVFFLQEYFEVDLSILGIQPRKGIGLIGVATGPLVHGNLKHILSNTVPILVLGGMLYFFYPRIAGRVFLQAYFFTNFFVWLLARPFIHLGSSGFVHALAFFLIFLGLFKRDFKTLLISVSVLLVYGSLVYGVFVLDDRISWEAHVFGAIVGIGTAYSINKFTRHQY